MIKDNKESKYRYENEKEVAKGYWICLRSDLKIESQSDVHSNIVYFHKIKLNTFSCF